MYEWQVKLDADETWLCRHVDADGKTLASATRLRLDQTREWNPGAATSATKRWVECPACGAYWRVWAARGVAKPYVERDHEASKSWRYRRAPVRDIDRVIDAVARQLPTVDVWQHMDVHPDDDEGLWFFGRSIQIESGDGMCPFIIEHDGMASAADAWREWTVEDVARRVVDYLSADEGEQSE